jgi:phosphoribosylglycinamide formyltransferase-1
MKPRIAILASGGGTTAETFIRAGATGQISAEVGVIIVSRKDAGIFDRIKGLNQELSLDIKCELINAQTHPVAEGEIVERGGQTIAEEQAIIDLIKAGNFDLVALMGYMKRIGPKLVREFGWRPEYTSPYQAMMLNTHPGLFPETKGLYGLLCQEKVIADKLPEAGQTLHVVSEDYDDGPTIAEHRIAVNPNDTAETLFTRVRVIEKQNLPTDIEAFIQVREQYRTVT